MGLTSWNCRHRWCPPSHSSHFIGKIRTKSSKTIPKSSNWPPMFAEKNHGILHIAGEISWHPAMTFYAVLGCAEQHARAEQFPKGSMSWGSWGILEDPGDWWWLEDDYLINGSGWDFIYLHMDFIDLYTDWWFGTWLLWLSIQLGMSSSQLTKSIIFQRGRYTTNQMWMIVEDTDPINDRLFFAINIGWNIDKWW